MFIFQMLLPNVWSRHRSFREQTGVAYAKSPTSYLQTLPPELIQMIAFQLSLSDAANLTLVNRKFSLIIAPTYWLRLRTTAATPRQRERFLTTLTRDLPAWLYCYSCSHLHPCDRIGPPGPRKQPSKPLSCVQSKNEDSHLQYAEVYGNFSCYTFTFLAVLSTEPSTKS